MRMLLTGEFSVIAEVRAALKGCQGLGDPTVTTMYLEDSTDSQSLLSSLKTMLFTLFDFEHTYHLLFFFSYFSLLK